MENQPENKTMLSIWTKNNERIRVCKLFFVDTLAISNKMIETVVRKKESDNDYDKTHDLRGKTAPGNKTPEEIVDKIKDHINSIPRVESHYCRAQSKKEYIDGIRSLTSIYNDYKEARENADEPFATLPVFRRIFETEFNISFFVPKKDQCDLCIKYTNTTEDPEFDEEDRKYLSLKDKYDEHLAEKILSREEKKGDKIGAENGNVVTAVYDLQAVLTCPRANSSTFYYKSKLNNYNLSVFNFGTKKADCYFWNEVEGNRGADEIGNCILKFLQKIDEEATQPKDVIFFSDNCAGQQKNR